MLLRDSIMKVRGKSYVDIRRLTLIGVFKEYIWLYIVFTLPL